MTDSTFAATVLPPIPSTPSHASDTTDDPGRWVGGLIGASLSLGLALIARVVGASLSGDVEVIDWALAIGLLGIPVGFAIGRAFLPAARSSGWRHALVVGLGLGWLAPPLGAPLALSALFADSSMCGPERVVVWFAFLLFAVVISFGAIVVTIPLGILWALAVRALPARWLAAARMPAPIDRLGTRHLFLVVAIGVVAVVLSGSASGCPGAFS